MQAVACDVDSSAVPLPRSLSGVLPPIVGGGLQRRASAPVAGRGFGGGAFVDASDGRGLPVNYTLRTSGKAKPSKRERVLCTASLLSAAALAFCLWLVWQLVRHNRLTHRHATSHYEGWKLTYDELVTKHDELNKHKQELQRANSQLQLKQARSQLEGASQQLTQFHAAMEQKDASLAQLQSEHWALRDTMLAMESRWAEEKAAHGHGQGLADELAQARDEESRLRASLQRCYVDYTAAVDALTKAEEMLHPSRVTPDLNYHQHGGDGHATHGDAGAQHGAHWRSGGHAGDTRAPLWADDAEARGRYASMANRA